MTKEQIIKMAREAGFVVDVSTDPNSPPSWWGCAHNDTFERFAALVAAAERETCAKVCEDGINSEQYPTLTEIAAAIRARGQNE
jgi:hypothetical protein